jgi:DNA-binding TFAR19-related protein (PDSD5 family)
MDSLEQIRQKKLEELQAQMQNRLQEEQQVQQEIQQLELAVKQRMTKDALQRFGNIKAADPEKAVQLLVVLAQLMQQGKVQKIDDAVLKNILKQVTPKRRDFNIKRR